MRANVDDLAQEIRRVWKRSMGVGVLAENLLPFFEAAILAAEQREREACAQVADDNTPEKFVGALAGHVTGRNIATAIRNRTQEPS